MGKSDYERFWKWLLTRKLPLIQDMRGYDRDELDRPMEDLDEYEEDGYEEYEDIGEDGYGHEGEEEEEEEEEEGGEAEQYEDPEVAKQREEYLALRQRLKEKLRKQMKKENGSAHSNSLASRKKLPYDNYGSFFGPSQPVIAQRVIQESKSLLEIQHLQSRVSKSGHSHKKSSSTAARQKPIARESSSKVVNNALKTKVQKARDTRDYSFLLSDDAELPAPIKAPPPRSVSVPKSDARPTQLPNKSKQSLGTAGRQVPSVHEERAPAPRKPQLQPRVASEKVLSASRPASTSMDSRKSLGSNNGYGPGRPVGSKGPPARMPPKTPVMMAGRKNSAVVAKNSVAVKNVMSAVQRTVPPKVQPPIQKQHLDQRRQLPEQNRSKVISKQTVPPSKPTMKPPKQIPSRATPQQRPRERPLERAPAKRPARRYSDDEDDDDDGGHAISMIRQMFRYNPKKYVDDDDDSNMEANFADILKEERRSAKIAREEDERELRLIEEEERREQMRREAKRRKLSQR
ncbi:Chromatin SPT2 [Dillenia turbinata]|uniref:Chromatin SPT2 n=1 Tax=Dillenia turbinata TaxID=194707 RepID=A0AAN8UU43_9MAGN